MNNLNILLNEGEKTHKQIKIPRKTNTHLNLLCKSWPVFISTNCINDRDSFLTA